MPSVAPRTKMISLDRRGVEEAPHLLARGLVGVGRARRQRVGGAVDVGVLVLVEMREAVDHRLRLLRRRGVVEPDQRLAVDLLLQDREVAPDRIASKGARAIAELARSCGYELGGCLPRGSRGAARHEAWQVAGWLGQ